MENSAQLLNNKTVTRTDAVQLDSTKECEYCSFWSSSSDLPHHERAYSRSSGLETQESHVFALFLMHHNDLSSPLRACLLISMLHVFHLRVFHLRHANQNDSSAGRGAEALTAQDFDWD